MTQNITFKDFNLSSDLLESISKKGFAEPTAIQAMTIPLLLEGTQDLIAQAQTGTGKTGAFGIPLIESGDTDSRDTQALILVPTRELALQVSDELNSLKGNKALRICSIYGGDSYDRQIRELKQGVHIVVGTPGRIMDHIRRKTLKLKKISCLVLDEADEMLNMGFISAIEEIMTFTNPDKRILLFSATMPVKIKNLAKKYLKEHEVVAVKREAAAPSLTVQKCVSIKESRKIDALSRFIDVELEFYGMVFCRTKRDVDTVSSCLVERGYHSAPIHGDISQAQRERTLARFKSKKVTILVASDVAARGIDVNDLTHVINYSLPQDSESYIHRIGRTGRAGKTGTALTFVTPGERKRFTQMKRSFNGEVIESKIPEVSDIIAGKKDRITEMLLSKTNDLDKTYFNWAKQLMETNNPTELLASVLNHCFKKELNTDAYLPPDKSPEIMKPAKSNYSTPSKWNKNKKGKKPMRPSSRFASRSAS